MKNYTLAFTLILAACGGSKSSKSSSDADSSPVPKIDVSNARILALTSDLPSCDVTNALQIVYIQATATYEECQDHTWNVVGVPATDAQPAVAAATPAASSGASNADTDSSTASTTVASSDDSGSVVAPPAPQFAPIPGPMDSATKIFSFCYSSTLGGIMDGASTVTVSFDQSSYYNMTTVPYSTLDAYMDINGPSAARYSYPGFPTMAVWDANVVKTTIIHDFQMTEVGCPLN